MRWAKQHNLHTKTLFSEALIMFSEQKHTCGNKYARFNKRQKIYGQDKRTKDTRAKAHCKYSQKLTTPHIAHKYSLPKMHSLKLYSLYLKKDNKK